MTARKKSAKPAAVPVAALTHATDTRSNIPTRGLAGDGFGGRLHGDSRFRPAELTGSRDYADPIRGRP
jgi:hypothetical protein